MKLLFGYTLDIIKRNRRGSMAIMVAILMTATMLSALCGFLYNVYADNLSLILRETGNWHGELFDNTPGSALPIIERVDSVEAVRIKGDWKTAQIDDPRREYLVWRDANAAYWEGMPEGDIAILSGRTPAQIKRSVILEALLLTAAPLPLGLALGQSIVWLFIQYANSTIVPGSGEPMAFVIGWQAVLPAILLTLFTIWWSALIPARRISHPARRRGEAQKAGTVLLRTARRAVRSAGGIGGERATGSQEELSHRHRLADPFISRARLSALHQFRLHRQPRRLPKR